VADGEFYDTPARHSSAILILYAAMLVDRQSMHASLADCGPIKIPDGLTDEQVLFLSDIFNGLYGCRELQYSTAIHCDLGLRPGGTIRHQERLYAGSRACDCHRSHPERLRMAQEQGRAEVINYEGTDVVGDAASR